MIGELQLYQTKVEVNSFSMVYYLYVKIKQKCLFSGTISKAVTKIWPISRLVPKPTTQLYRELFKRIMMNGQIANLSISRVQKVRKTPLFVKRNNISIIFLYLLYVSKENKQYGQFWKKPQNGQIWSSAENATYL